MSDNKYYVNYKTGRSPIAVIHTPTSAGSKPLLLLLGSLGLA